MPSAFFLSLLPLPFASSLSGVHLASTASTSHEPLTVRSLLARAFAIHGQHVASNQIRVLLICSVFMTTLLYPALAIHYQTVSAPGGNPSAIQRPGSLAGTPLLRPLFSSSSTTDARVNEFPWAGREGASGMESLEGWSFTNEVGEGGAGVRLETVWLGEVAHLRNADEFDLALDGTFDSDTFVRALATHNATLPDLIQCFSPPPLVSLTSPWTAVTCAFAAAGDQSWDESHWIRSVHDALHTMDTLHATYGRSSSSTSRFRSTMSFSSESSVSSSQQPSTYSSNQPSSSQSPAHPVLFLAKSLLPIPILALYTFLFAWTFRSLQKFTQIHNRVGIAFTYVVELAASTTCSGSLCVMLGWKLEGVPWFLLPFVITVVGVENMVHVTNAIVTTPVHMTVRERLGLGLSLAGPRITFTTLADILILSLVGMVLGEKAGVIKEFCRFGIIVLVADWFLLFTFFTTVISIDMQRLELAEVLQQGTPATPLVPADSTFPSSTPSPPANQPRRRRRTKDSRAGSKTSSEVLVSGFQAILRARTARNGSLLALMGGLVGLWYYHGGLREVPLATMRTASQALPLPGPFDPARLWEYVNPARLPSILLTVPSPLAVIISTVPSQPSPASYLASLNALSTQRSLTIFSVDRSAPLTWFCQIFLPVPATTFIVYLILRFLLKDADLLDAQQDRLEIGEEWDEDDLEGTHAMPSTAEPTISTLPTRHQADVSLIATSTTRLLSIGFDGIALLWSTSDPTEEPTPLALELLAGDRVTHAVLDQAGRHCAVATVKGGVRVWSLGAKFALPVPVVFAAAASRASLSPVSTIKFLPFDPITSQDHANPPAILVVVREDGEVVELDCRKAVVDTKLASSMHSIRATPLWKFRTLDRSVDLALVDEGGLVRILRRDAPSFSWSERLSVQLEAGQRVSKVASSPIARQGASDDVLAITTTSGLITLWDSTGKQLISVNPNLRRLQRVRLVDPVVQECADCNQKTDGFLLLASNPEELAFYRVTSEAAGGPPCACPATKRSLSTSTQRTSLDRMSFDSSPLRARGPSFSTFVPPISPSLHRRMPTSMSTASNLSADYPMAGHGVHSRRLSTRDKRADAAEEILVDPEDKKLVSADDPFTARSSPDNTTAPALRSVLLGSVSVRKGAWDLLESGQVVGVGRASRSGGRTSLDSSSSIFSGFASNPSSGKWKVWHVDTRRPSRGHDLALSIFDLQALKEDPRGGCSSTPDDKTEEGLTAGGEASALRRRRAARVKAYSQSQAVSSTRTVAPKVAHTVVSPLVAAGPNVVYAGTGNALRRLAFPSASTPLGHRINSMVTPPTSPPRVPSPSDSLQRRQQ